VTPAQVFSGKDICSSAGILDIGIWFPFDYFFDREAGGFEAELDLCRLKKQKIHGDFLSPQFFFSNNLIPGVKPKQQEAIGAQDPVDFLEHHGQRLPGNVYDGIEGGDPRERFVREVEGQHVPFAKGNAGIEPSSLLHHARGEVEAKDGCAGIPQIASHVTGAAPHVAYLASSLSLLGEAVEQLAIERLVLEFVRDPAGVLLGEAIVALSD